MKTPVQWLIERALRTPYFHLRHADNSLYMARYWLVPFAGSGSHSDVGCFAASWWRQPFTWLLQKLGIAVRIHCIATGDLDRALHDHPWTFISVLLRGRYDEARPVTPNNAIFERVPVTFSGLTTPSEYVEAEPVTLRTRFPGSIALRRFSDRHRIVRVSDNVWTLFITFKKRQSWGFYTPQGKLWWWVFESVHKSAIK